MPAEWEPHAATWIAWPHNRTDWPGKFEPIPWVYASIVRHLVAHERVEIIVNDSHQQRAAVAALKLAHVPLDNLRFHRWHTNRCWTRDYGPMFVRVQRSTAAAQQASRLAIVDWHFNAWAKYRDWKHDRAIAASASRKLGLELISAELPTRGKAARVVLEGGAIDVNGRGTVMLTRECLLSRTQQRNPGLSRRDLEQVLASYLGATKVIWLNRGIAGDDTHGHIDDIARFVAPNTAVAAVENNPGDPNYGPLQENLRQLKNETDQDGRPLRVIELPMPSPVFFRGQRLPASYANFYIANGIVLVPIFNDPNDRTALNTLAELFPDRSVVGVYCGDLIWGLGAIHCMTQQQPL